VCAALIVVSLAGAGDLIVSLLYDERYSEAQWMLPVLALGLWPAALYVTLDPMLQAIGKPFYSAYAHAAKLVFSAIAIPVAFAKWGVAGAVGAVALNDLPHYAAISYALHRERLGSLREDFAATLIFALMLGVVVVIRWLCGLHLP
jgi:O-antigen/teichoic acid export membrane protein